MQRRAQPAELTPSARGAGDLVTEGGEESMLSEEEFSAKYCFLLPTDAIHSTRLLLLQLEVAQENLLEECKTF